MNDELFAKLQASLPIDRDLETALRAHTDYYFEVCRACAQAQNEVDSLKFDLSYTEAAIQEGIRRAAEKITEAGVTAKVKQDELYVTAYNLYLGAVRSASEWSALKAAYESRSHCLRDLTALATRGVNSAGISQYSNLRDNAAAVRARPRPPSA